MENNMSNKIMSIEIWCVIKKGFSRHKNKYNQKHEIPLRYICIDCKWRDKFSNQCQVSNVHSEDHGLSFILHSLKFYIRKYGSVARTVTQWVLRMTSSRCRHYSILYISATHMSSFQTLSKILKGTVTMHETSNHDLWQGLSAKPTFRDCPKPARKAIVKTWNSQAEDSCLFLRHRFHCLWDPGGQWNHNVLACPVIFHHRLLKPSVKRKKTTIYKWIHPVYYQPLQDFNLVTNRWKDQHGPTAIVWRRKKASFTNAP